MVGNSLGHFDLIFLHPVHDGYVAYAQQPLYFPKTYPFYVELQRFNDVIRTNALTEFVNGKIIITLLATKSLSVFNDSVFDGF
jgi:hypothetical protein